MSKTTIKRRLNITLTPEIDNALSLLASRDNVPQATKAAELLSVAIDLQEDVLLGKIADTRNTNAATYISHEKAWA